MGHDLAGSCCTASSPAPIHLPVLAPGAVTRLVTQMYLAGDTMLEWDRIRPSVPDTAARAHGGRAIAATRAPVTTGIERLVFTHTLVLLDPAREPPRRRARQPGRGATSTAESLEWSAWVPVQDLATATPKQIAVLDESHAKARTGDYYLLLVQAPEVLRQRSRLFNTIMYGPRGASRAEREPAAGAESRLMQTLGEPRMPN